MTIDTLLASLSISRDAARREGQFHVAEDYEDAMLMVLSSAYDAGAHAGAAWRAVVAPLDGFHVC